EGAPVGWRIRLARGRAPQEPWTAVGPELLGRDQVAPPPPPPLVRQSGRGRQAEGHTEALCTTPRRADRFRVVDEHEQPAGDQRAQVVHGGGEGSEAFGLAIRPRRPGRCPRGPALVLWPAQGGEHVAGLREYGLLHGAIAIEP